MSVKETLDIKGLPFGGRWAVQRLNWPIKKPQSLLELFENGAQTWNRTRDTRIFNPYIWLLFTYFTITYNYIVYITVYNIGCYI